MPQAERRKVMVLLVEDISFTFMSRVVEYSLVALVEDYAYLASMSQNESASGAVTVCSFSGT